MAQQVSNFCSKTKQQMPTVEFEQAQGSQEPCCTCTVTLHAYFDADNDGFPEMTFTETARTKKASKGAAMAKTHEFLASTAVYKKVMSAAQVSGPRDSWRQPVLPPGAFRTLSTSLIMHH